MPVDAGSNPARSNANRTSYNGAMTQIRVKFRGLSVMVASQQITLEAAVFNVLVRMLASHVG